jgi:general secretion pathway protein F
MSDGRAGLPALTRFVLNMTHHVGTFWIAVAVLIGVTIFVWTSLSASAGGRRLKEGFVMGLPFVGRVYKNGLLSRYAECLSVLVNAGCTLDSAVDLSGQSAGSERLKTDSLTIAAQLQQGSNFLEAGLQCKTIPRLFLYAVQLGAQRNELKDNLNSVARMYANKTFSLQTQLQAMLMPTMIILIGGFVTMIVLAMFLPMVKMIQVLM